MGTGLSSLERELLDELWLDGVQVVRNRDVRRVRGVRTATADQILARLARKGWLLRAARGVYMPAPRDPENAALEDLWPAMVERFAPCYISGDSAARYWGLTDRAREHVYIVTARPQRRSRHVIDGVAVRTHTGRIFGTETIEIDGHPVPVADPHRTLVDSLDHRCFEPWADTLFAARGYFEQHDPDAALQHAKRLGNGTALKRLGFLAEVFEATFTARWIQDCQAALTPGIRLLDPTGWKGGKLNRRWRLWVNLSYRLYQRPEQ